MTETEVQENGMDKEWIQLIIEAKELGIEKEEILAFLDSK